MQEEWKFCLVKCTSYDFSPLILALSPLNKLYFVHIYGYSMKVSCNVSPSNLPFVKSLIDRSDSLINMRNNINMI